MQQSYTVTSVSRGLEGFWYDTRHAVGRMWRDPWFTIVVVSSLALGIGANTAIFSLIHALSFSSLPVSNPRELAEIRIVGGNPGFGVFDPPYGELPRPVWQEIRNRQRSFSGMFAWSAERLRIGPPSETRRVSGIRVSGDFFRILGVPAWRGRLTGQEDETALCPATVAVASYSFWRSVLGGREIDVQNTLLVNGLSIQVIGVTPPGFFGVAVGDRFDLALPLCRENVLHPDFFELSVMGRLRPDSNLARASAELDVISPSIFAATAPDGYTESSVATFRAFRLAAYSAETGVNRLSGTYDLSLILLLGVTGLVLLIACANLANLMLSRLSARQGEITLRMAIGAPRYRLAWQLLAESCLQAAIGCSLGIFLARLLASTLVSSLSTQRVPLSLSVATNRSVLLFSSIVGCATCAIFGAVPAMHAINSASANPTRTSGLRVAGDRRHFALQRFIVVVQVAISLVLIVAALLFIRSFRNMAILDPGMRRTHITAAGFDFAQSPILKEHYREFSRELLDEVRSVPGVVDAASTTVVPLLGGSWSHVVSVGQAEGASEFTWVSPGYFRTMGIPVLMGRSFNLDDAEGSTRVAIVNKTFVSQFLRGANPLNTALRTHVEPDYPSTVYQIVGVIPDTKYDDLRGATPPMAFAPAAQFPAPSSWVSIMIYSEVPPDRIKAEIKRRVAAKHPEVMIELNSFEERLDDRMVREHLMALLSGFFGVVAALLSALGLYGVISYLVASRRTELGIRFALGATRGDVVGMVLSDVSRILAIGLVLGSLLSLAAGRSARSLLFELSPYDPPTLVGCVVLLTVVAFLAASVPVYRACKLDPVVVLRCE